MDSLNTLINRSQNGDRTAAAALWRQLQPHFPRVIRRALAQRQATSPLTRLVREAAHGVLAEPDGRQLGRHDLLNRIAQRSYDMLVRNSGRSPTWCTESHETAVGLRS